MMKGTISKAPRSMGTPWPCFARLADKPERAARVRTLIGRPEEAMKDLGYALADAKKGGYVAYEFAARLALGEAEIKARKPAARNALESLEREARAAGFGSGSIRGGNFKLTHYPRLWSGGPKGSFSPPCD